MFVESLQHIVSDLKADKSGQVYLRHKDGKYMLLKREHFKVLNGDLFIDLRGGELE